MNSTDREAAIMNAATLLEEKATRNNTDVMIKEFFLF